MISTNQQNGEKSNKIADKALLSVGKFLENRGWKVAVVQFDRIEKGSDKYNFELIVGFTGVPPKNDL